MAPVDAEFIIEAYQDIKGGTRTADNVFRAITAAMAIADGGISFTLQEAISWAVRKIMSSGVDKVILATLIKLEYYKRYARKRGVFDFGAARHAMSLRNRCGDCGLKGHNSRNCSYELKDFLFTYGLAEDVADVPEFLE